MRSTLVLALAISGLGCEAPELPPPPIDGGATSGPVVGGQASGSAADASGTLDGSGTGQASGSTTEGGTALVSGRLLDGPAMVQPVVCFVRLHSLESFDPGSGLPVEAFYEEPVIVRALPQSYAIVSVTDGVVGPGDSVYVSTVCDVDGDGIGDGVGAFYPGIPVEPVQLPAVEIDLPLDLIL